MSDKYKGVIIEGSIFPDDPIKTDLKINFTKELLSEYLPVWEEVTKNDNLGLKLLMFIMASKEGFEKGSRSHDNNNPANIGNTDSGKNKYFATLREGVEAQREYVLRVAKGLHPAYKIGKLITLKPFYSKEIANNPKTYAGMSPYVAGYRFTYTGQLNQFVKIYSTGSRQRNGYLSYIISYFKNHGITITQHSRISEIVEIVKK
jgi:hypothetical protein